MIKNLTLKNFQKHTLLELNFQEGLNIIYGHTDSGKSSIVRALRWILFDDFSSNEARKQGTKETAVTVAFDSGISVTRIKSNSVNAYEIKQGEEVKRFDSIGKGIPEEIEKIFGMELFEVDGIKINLNIAEQLSAPFLLGKEYPSTFRAKLFNQLTGNDLQDKLFKDLNKEILGFGKEITAAEKLTEEQTKELEVIKAEQVNCDKKHDNLTNYLAFVEDLEEQRKLYLSLIQRVKANKEALFTAQTVKKSIKLVDQAIIDQIKVDITALTVQKGLLERLVGVKKNIAEAEARKLKIRVPDLQFDEIYGILNDIDKARHILEDLKWNKQKITEAEATRKKLEDSLKKQEEELAELKKNFTTCPLCEKVIANEDIEKLKASI